MFHTLMLIPTDAEAYSYWPIVAHFDTNVDHLLMVTAPTSCGAEVLRAVLFDGATPPPCDHFLWGFATQAVDASHITRWSVIRITADTRGGVEYLATYQSDRLWSGIHPSYTDTIVEDS
jgi:hypothetical protein